MSECDPKASIMRKPSLSRGCCSMVEKTTEKIKYCRATTPFKNSFIVHTEFEREITAWIVCVTSGRNRFSAGSNFATIICGRMRHGSDARDNQASDVWLMADVGNRDVPSCLYHFELKA